MAREADVKIETLTRRGEGRASGPDGAVFVPFSVPGETVRVQFDNSGKRARLLDVLDASGDRIDPFCPHFRRCGGCVVQHLSPRAYRDWKRGLVVAALKHRGIDVPVDSLMDAHGQGRRRAVLHARVVRNQPIAGFMETRSHRIVDLRNCPILVDALADAPAMARALAGALRWRPRPIDIAFTATEQGVDCALAGCDDLDLEERMALTDLAVRMGLVRLMADDDPIMERAQPVLIMGRAHVVPPPRSFLQATAEGEAVLAGRVLSALAGVGRIADLFCGIGPFALRLAEHAPVLAVDNDAAALAALDRAASTVQGLKPITTEVRDLLRGPLSNDELRGIDGVVFDPPRAGAEAQAQALARSTVPVVAAVSCDPATFARDAAHLIAGGYHLEQVTPVDQFKWTAHVELVGIFRRW